jgi:hypothetical protein
MEKDQIKKEILSLIENEIDQWLDTQVTITDGHEYEEKFIGVAQKVSKIILSQSVGDLPKNRNKKKTPDLFWENRNEQNTPDSPAYFPLWDKFQIAGTAMFSRSGICI